MDEATLAQTVAAAHKILRPVDGDSLDLIEPKYTTLRSSLLSFYGALRFQAVRGPDDPALRALDHVQHLAQHDRRVTALRQRVAGTMLAAPFAHVTRRWRKHIYDAQKKIRPNYYEAAAFDGLRARLRSGDIAVVGSRRYRTFESYLLPKASWRAAVQTGRTGLASEPDVHRYLATAEEQLRTRLAALADNLGEASGLTRDEKGKWHLRALGRVVPDAAVAARRRVYARLPRVPLAELLLEVDAWTGFLSQFTHLVDGVPPTGEDRLALVGALLGQGLNQGLHKMAEATPFTYHRLAWASEWHIREETLLSAQVVLDNFVLHRPLAPAWGDGTRSSSDGMRVKVAVRAANTDPNPEYYGPERGVTFYGHLADIDMPFGRAQVISTNDREALYVIDALCHHESEFRIREHYTDSAGSTEHVFGLCRLLDFDFAPRIKRVLAQHLYTLGGVAVPAALASLVPGRIRTRLIVEHWDELRWVAASIQQGTVAAALLLRKLAAYPRQNRLAQALAELGKLEKTLFLLEYLRDPELRRRVHRGLAKGEAKHALERALFFGRRGELWERAFRDQVYRASCLQLLVAAIGAWNTVYLGQSLAALEVEGQGVPAEFLPHVSPLGWEHINLLGRYSFETQASWALDHLRPLRGEAEIEVEDDGDRPVRRRRSRKQVDLPGQVVASPVRAGATALA